MRQQTYSEFLLNLYREAIKPGSLDFPVIESSKCSLRKEEKESFYLLKESNNLKIAALFPQKSLARTQKNLRILAIKIRRDYPDFKKWIILNREENVLTATLLLLKF